MTNDSYGPAELHKSRFFSHLENDTKKRNQIMPRFAVKGHVTNGVTSILAIMIKVISDTMPNSHAVFFTTDFFSSPQKKPSSQQYFSEKRSLWFS